MTSRKTLSYLSLGLALASYPAFAQSMMSAPGSASGAPPTPPGIIWNQPGQTTTAPPPTSAPPAQRPLAAPKPAPMAMAPNPDQRNIDDRKLNSLAAQYMHINTKAPDATAKLAKLSKQVNAFHQALFTRGYNAMDILKDTENLQKRIAAAKAKAATEANSAPAPTPASAPTPQAPVAPAPVPPPPASSQ